MENVERSTFVTVPCLALLLLLPLPGVSTADPGNNYCITPPFISSGIQPNLLLMIDNSASMYDLQYQDTTNMYCANAATTSCVAGSTCAGAATCVSSGVTSTVNSAAACVNDADCSALLAGDTCNKGHNTCKNATVSTTTFTPTACTVDATCSAVTAGDTCNNKCNVPHQCYDTTYDNTKSYYGYFSAGTYSYDFTDNKFTAGAAMPLAAACTYSAGSPLYVCVKTTGAAGTSAEAVVTTGGGFTASGNFLNWLTASKFDVEKQILTGGKFETDVLIAESRGCAGRKFIKSVPGVNLTFAVRGGTSGGLSVTQNQATEYGQTFLEIYTGTYNAAACVAALDDWLNVDTVQLGKFQNDTKACVGAGNGVLNGTSMWNHILHDCYQGMNDQAQGYSTNLNSLQGECESIYASIPPSDLVDTNYGGAICSSALTYVDGSGTARTGYLGACYNTTTHVWDDDCAESRMEDYCTLNINANPVVDPSATTITGSNQSAPGFILEQGLMNTFKVASLEVRVAAAEPIGLIQKFQDQIRFGAMTFQNNGSGSECGPGTSIPCAKACSQTTERFCYFDSDCPATETCGVLAKTDGGTLKNIATYVGAGKCSVTTAADCAVDADCSAGETCVTSVGSHSSGLIKSINEIPATSWTPVGEAFYNAIGYFARANAYSATPPTSRSAGGLSTLPSPNTAASYLTTKNPSQFVCQTNNVLLITDGMSTADRSTTSEALASLYASQVPNTIGATTTYGLSGYDAVNQCPSYSGSRSLSALAWIAKHRNIKTLATSGTASTTGPEKLSESISTYVAYSGPTSSGAPGLCDPLTLMTNTATNGGSELFVAQDPADLHSKLERALLSIAAQTASGTAASILSNSEGSGANILQAVFYPKKVFTNGTSSTSANWIGEMQNLWYFVDPLINNSTIREDTDSNLALNLVSDKVVNFRFVSNGTDNATYAYTSTDTNGDGLGDTAEVKQDPDLVKSIWRAGKQLYLRDLSVSPRTIYTPLLPGGTEAGSTGLMKFNYGTVTTSPPYTLAAGMTLGPNNSSALKAYLQETTDDGAVKLMKYVHGFDFPGDSLMRNRTVQIGSVPAATVSTVSTDPYVTKPRDKGIGVWKLGDIIASTPRLQSTGRLNSYGLLPPSGYSDASYNSFIASNDYLSRGMVYVGANDGMLHAFKLGRLDVSASGFNKAWLTGTGLGEEQWAFIPKHTLPYLKYHSDPAYNHLYYIDGPTLVFDASIGDHTGSNGCTKATYDTCIKNASVVNGSNQVDASKNTWMTVLIGSTGLGGASSKSCTEGSNCVQTPRTDPADADKGLGYSSYFALNVTDPEQPSLLWEFSNSALGFASTGPAIVRVGDPLKNGRWFAVFGSGPTGPIDTDTHQFMGRSDQNLKFFVVDLRTGTLERTIDTGITEAFAGSMVGGAIDADRWNRNAAGNYQDDAIYVGYTKKSGTTWTAGGVVRIFTKESLDPDDWVVRPLIGDVGPVTNSISRLQDKKNKNLWLYFGTGRYFSRSGNTLDDYGTQRSIYGIKDPCYNTAGAPGNLLDKNCEALVESGITDQSTEIGAVGSGGWKIDLSPSTADFGAERVVTDAVALTNGALFITSFMPTADACGFGGNSYLWALDYKSGDRPPDAALEGKALIQLSTGEFKNVDLNTAFGAGAARLMRRTSAPMTGKPPADAFPILSKSGNKPVKRILHIQER